MRNLIKLHMEGDSYSARRMVPNSCSILTCMPGIPIHLARPPFSARLLLWGRAEDGWWGLVEWAQTIRRGGALETSSFAAWVPAGALSRPGWSAQAPAIARITLPGARPDWPAPAGWSGWFAGAWPSGPVRTPDGVELVTGPRWRHGR